MESFKPNPSTVLIDGDAYRLVRNDEGQLYTQEYAEEPPYSEGTPALVSDPAYTWHLGGLKSRQGIPGTSEYGVNTDCRWPFQILPGPKINTFTLPDSAQAPSVAWFGANHIWIASAARLYRIQFQSLAITQSSTGLGTNVNHGIEWANVQYVALTNDNVYSNSGGTDTWADAGTLTATRFAKGFNKLFKAVDNADETLTLKNILQGVANPETEANWGDNVLMPGQVDDLVPYDRTVIVNGGRFAGIMGVGEEGFGIPLAKRLLPSAAGAIKFIEPYLYIPHYAGLARFLPGSVEGVGLENEIMNDSAVRGQVQGVASDGNWIYIAVYNGTDTHVLAGRERRGSEPGFGPMVWDTLFTLTGQSINFFEVFPSVNKQHLVFNYGVNAGYVILPQTGGAPEVNDSAYRFATSGTRFTYEYNFDDRGEKDFPKVSLQGSGLDSTTYWELAYSIDGAAYVTTDINGNNMRLNSNSLTTFFLATTAHGRKIKYRFTYTGASDQAAGRITYFEPFAIPRSRRVPLVGCLFLLESGIRHEDRLDERTALEQYNDLQTLLESATAVSAIGPWSSSASNIFIRSLKIVKTDQMGEGEQRFTVQAIFQLREAT